MCNLLEVRNLSKSYSHYKALDNVSFAISNGMYALLGPNGAGKSTLMNIITDNLLPDKGEVLWNGRPTIKLGRFFRRQLGYMPQQQGLYDGFTARRFLCYMAALKEISEKCLKEEVRRVSSIVSLQKDLDRKLSAFSGGMKQRILIAQAMLGNPQLLIMDEPTAGLDPKERIHLRNLASQLGKDHIVLFSTHVVSDIETVASEILLLKTGKLVQKATRNALVDKFSPKGTLENVYMKIFAETEAE